MFDFNNLLVKFFISVFILGIAHSQDPTAVFKLTKAKVTMAPNPYFDDWAVALESGGTVVTLKTPVKADVPEDMRVKFVLDFAGMEIPEYEMTLCESFDDETIGKDILKSVEPPNFPKACKIKSGKDFVIKSWKIPSQKIPPGMPDGKVVGVVTVFMPGQKPIITIDVEGNLSHKVPGLGR